MNIIHQETTRRYCHQCQKLRWHHRYGLGSRFRVYLALLTFFTLGLAWIVYYWLNQFYGAWRCKYCGKSERELGTGRRQLSPTAERCDFVDDPVQTEVPIQSSLRTDSTPRLRRGSYSDSKAFLNRPKFGCSQEEYWAWHDTLYLGGSCDSPEWKDRARQAKARDHYQCIFCGSGENLETDHIIELSRGGSNDFDNLQTLCSACHHKKTAENRHRVGRQ